MQRGSRSDFPPSEIYKNLFGVTDKEEQVVVLPSDYSSLFAFIAARDESHRSCLCPNRDETF